jgi:hypothetical protein
MAKIAREVDPEVTSIAAVIGTACVSAESSRPQLESDWDRYLARLDAAASHAAASVLAACEARTRGGRIDRMRDWMQRLMAAYDDEVRSTRASFVQALEAGPQMALTLWDLPPGEAGSPHRHRLGKQQLLLVLAGRPILRTPGGSA